MSGHRQLLAFSGAVILGLATATVLFIIHLKEQLLHLCAENECLRSTSVTHDDDDSVTSVELIRGSRNPSSLPEAPKKEKKVKVHRSPCRQECDDIYLPLPSICNNSDTVTISDLSDDTYGGNYDDNFREKIDDYPLRRNFGLEDSDVVSELDDEYNESDFEIPRLNLGEYGDSDDSDSCSDARGLSSDARGRSSDARGQSSDARGRSSDARGRGSDARGRSSDARGRSSDARGRGSDARGRGSDARNRSSDARGRSSDARNRGSDARGRGSDAPGQSGDVCGQGSDARNRGSDARDRCSDRSRDYRTSSSDDCDRFNNYRPSDYEDSPNDDNDCSRRKYCAGNTAEYDNRDELSVSRCDSDYRDAVECLSSNDDDVYHNREEPCRHESVFRSGDGPMRSKQRVTYKEKDCEGGGGGFRSRGHSPDGGDCSPDRRNYSSRGSSYSPQGGNRSPQGGDYAPQRGNRSPQGGDYSPQGGDYYEDEERNYCGDVRTNNIRFDSDQRKHTHSASQDDGDDSFRALSPRNKQHPCHPRLDKTQSRNDNPDRAVQRSNARHRSTSHRPPTNKHDDDSSSDECRHGARKSYDNRKTNARKDGHRENSSGITQRRESRSRDHSPSDVINERYSGQRSTALGEDYRDDNRERYHRQEGEDASYRNRPSDAYRNQPSDAAQMQPLRSEPPRDNLNSGRSAPSSPSLPSPLNDNARNRNQFTSDHSSQLPRDLTGVYRGEGSTPSHQQEPRDSSSRATRRSSVSKNIPSRKLTSDEMREEPVLMNQQQEKDQSEAINSFSSAPVCDLPLNTNHDQRTLPPTVPDMAKSQHPMNSKNNSLTIPRNVVDSQSLSRTSSGRTLLNVPLRAESFKAHSVRNSQDSPNDRPYPQPPSDLSDNSNSPPGTPLLSGESYISLFSNNLDLRTHPAQSAHTDTFENQPMFNRPDSEESPVEIDRHRPLASAADDKRKSGANPNRPPRKSEGANSDKKKSIPPQTHHEMPRKYSDEVDEHESPLSTVRDDPSRSFSSEPAQDEDPSRSFFSPPAAQGVRSLSIVDSDPVQSPPDTEPQDYVAVTITNAAKILSEMENDTSSTDEGEVIDNNGWSVPSDGSPLPPARSNDSPEHDGVGPTEYDPIPPEVEEEGDNSSRYDPYNRSRNLSFVASFATNLSLKLRSSGVTNTPRSSREKKRLPDKKSKTPEKKTKTPDKKDKTPDKKDKTPDKKDRTPDKKDKTPDKNGKPPEKRESAAEQLPPPPMPESQRIYQSSTGRSSGLSEPNRNPLFTKVDELFDGDDKSKTEAMRLLIAKKNDTPKAMRDADFVWRLAKGTYFMSQMECARNDRIKCKELVYEFKDIAALALKLDDRNWNTHKWWVIALGAVNKYEPTTEQIRNGFLYKTHLELALQLNSSDPVLHHLLGRWCYGARLTSPALDSISNVSMMSWVERHVATTLFTTPPQCSIDEALKHFKNAEQLSPGTWKENSLYIGKCYIEKKDKKRAKTWLMTARTIQTETPEDMKNHKEVEHLLTLLQ